MEIHPTIAALRGNLAAQRRAQFSLESVKAEWLAGHSDILGRPLEKYGQGADLGECKALDGVFQQKVARKPLIDGLMSRMGHAIARTPLGQIPFRHQYRSGVGVLQIATAGRANLSLLLYEAKAGPAAQSIYFTDSECTEIVLIGSGRGRLFEIVSTNHAGAVLSERQLDFQSGEVISYTGNKTTKLVETVPGSMLVLRLTRSPVVPEESREYRLADGALVHCASGNRAESRQEMIVALLGAMKRGEAVPTIADKCIEGTPHLRWQAIRQMLALDTARGFEVLCAVAAAPTDDLNAPAAALKAQLLKSYPVLSEMESA
ncbi:hypothetical protein GCM10023115_22110 [Pontixanthobacter gangjinensis]|uniref:Uncharacterized protein n=1 Tax=Pontixanthobacter gangjinensis TaxID=1028742 RepID=A0A6I4SNR4_9SPHN|nr:hypothetical protein [Pontixanthobacter gangjinensis]MXO57455.1 hypothetical protein [Pontixanthobacter gangjinensis]